MTSLLDRLLVRYVRSPEHPAKYRMVRWLGRHVFPSEGVIAEVEPGVKLRLHPRDWIEYVLLRDGRYEPRTLEFLSLNLRSSDTALLAGVNFGLHVIVAAKAVGPGGLVVGVEPQPGALARARANIGLNDVSARVRLVSVALGPGAGLVHMAWSRPDNPGAANLFDEGPGLTVSLVRLSDLIRDLCPGGPRLVLLDVEGFETSVLEGLDDAAHRPEIMVVEDEPRFMARAGTSRAQLYQRLTSSGYRLHDVHGAAVTAEGPAPAESNVVAVREGAAITWCAR